MSTRPFFQILLLMGFVSVLCLCPPLGTAYAQGVITTYVGTDWIFQGDGRPALQAPLGRVWNLASDSDGNIYAAEGSNSIVFKIDSKGNLTVVAGNGISGYSGDGGPATSASLNGPQGIAVDSDGSVFIADTNNQRIRKVTQDGTITTVAGTGAPGFNGDNQHATSANIWTPNAVALRNGEIYISEFSANRVRKVGKDGTITTVAGNGVAGLGDNVPAAGPVISGPVGLVLDSAGALYISEYSNHRVSRVINGTITGVGSPQGITPVGLAFDRDGALYVVDAGARVYKRPASGAFAAFAGTGAAGYSGDGGPALQATLNFPSGLAISSDGTVYIGDTFNFRVRKVSGGTITTVAGNGGYRRSPDGAQATKSFLNFYEFSALPIGMTIDSTGNLFFPDTENSVVRKVSPQGIVTTIAGTGSGVGAASGPATTVGLFRPNSVAADRQGNLYVLMGGGARVGKIDSNGILSPIAGSGASDPFVLSGIATSVPLNLAAGIAVTASGTVYIADTFHHAVRIVTPDGQMNTVAGTGQSGIAAAGTAATAAKLSSPTAVALDSNGVLYILDTGNHRVLKIVNGSIAVVVGTGQSGFTDGVPALQAQLSDPRGLAFDSAGNLYIADNGNNRVRKLTLSSGLVTTVAGNGKAAFAGDGLLATQASLNMPTGVAFDGAGNMLIADQGNNRIRLVLATPPSFSTAPNTLSFSAPAGGASPSAQSFAVSPQVSNPNLRATGLAFTVVSSDSWLTVDPPSGSLPTSLNVTVNPAALTPGTYTGTVTISVPLAVPPTQKVTVQFTVSSAQSPKLATNTSSLTFGTTQGAAPSTQSITVINQGGGSLSFTTSATTTTGGGWLSVSPGAGVATPGNSVSLGVTVTPGSMAPGTYSGNISVIGATQTQTLPVTLTVTATRRVILLSQAGLSFVAVSGGGNPLPQSFGILNIGQGSLDWTLQANTTSGGNWLSVSNSRGTVTSPYTDVSTVDVSLNVVGLSQGDYFGQISISAQGADNSPQFISVLLTVLPTGSNPGPEVRPSGLIFTGTQGSSPGSQQVSISDLSSSAFDYASGRLTTDGLPWFVHSPTNATVLPNQPNRMVVQPDFTTLSTGVHRGAITLQVQNDGTLRTVNVLAVVGPNATSKAAGGLAAGGCTPKQLLIQLTGSQPYITASVGQPTNIEVKVVDDCGNFVTNTTPGSSVTVSFNNGDRGGSMVYKGNGTWIMTYQPRSGGKAVTATVTVFLAIGTTTLGNQIDVNINVASSAPIVPLIDQNGVLNAASFLGGAPLAPGSLVSIFGQQFAGLNAAQLDGVQVQLGDQSLPLFYVGPQQINAQIPYTLAPNTQHQMLIQRDNVLSVPESFTVAAAQPGVFAVNQQGTGQGAITNAISGIVADAGHPVSAGDIISIYCTGLGLVSPAVAPGTTTPLSPLSPTVNTVRVLIGGVDAPVRFAGLAPGLIAAYQVNAVVPPGTTLGGAVPVVISVSGQTSPPVTIALR